MNVTWLMQNNMGSQSDINEYIAAVRNSGANVIEIDYKAFSEEVPDVNIEGPAVVYGTVNFIKQVYNSGRWPLAIFGNPETFTYEAWAVHYNEMLLNSPDNIQLTTVGDFCNDTRDVNEDIFVRPQNDTKSLVGAVWIAGQFKTWCLDAANGDYVDINKDTPIVIGKPYGIEAEWRLFVVDNKVISASQYHKKGRLYKEAGAPQDILDFANKVIERWNPAPAYTLDLCRSAGNCYIVEAQGFNSAGQYLCDMIAVAKAVNEVAIKLYNQNKF